MIALVRSNANFRRLFLAHAVSRAGDAFNTVALVVLVFQLTHSGLGVAGTVAFEILPVLLFGPIAGVVVDRFPRRRVMVLADLGRAGLAVVIALSHTSTPLAYAVAFGLSTGTMLFNPAASSLVPELVDNDRDLVDANSALWTVAVVAQILLAPLAGALIATVGVGWAFMLNAVSYLLSAVLLSGMAAGRTRADTTVAGWRSVTAGLAAVRGHPLLGRLVVVQALAALSAGATGGLLVVLAGERFGVGAGGFGLLLAAIGAGAVAGPALWRRSIRPGSRRWLFGPLAVRGAVDLMVAAVVNPVIAGGALVIYGMSTSTGMIAYQSTLQSEVEAQRRGRVFAFYDVVWNSARLVSLAAGGLLADAAGIRWVYVLGGILLLAAAGAGFGAPPRRPRTLVS